MVCVEVAGISYRIQGTGLPLLPRLSERYCPMSLGDPWLGSVASLEARGSSAGYLGIVGRLLEAVHLRQGRLLLPCHSTVPLARSVSNRERQTCD